MNRESVERKVKVVIANQMGLSSADIKEEDSLSMDLGVDSLDNIEIIVALEVEFDIEIPVENNNIFTTVEDVVDYVLERVEQSNKDKDNYNWSVVDINGVWLTIV